MNTPPIVAAFVTRPPALTTDYSQTSWHAALPHSLSRTWQGGFCPKPLHTTARLLWTPTDLWIGFSCGYSELDMDEQCDPTQERPSLWERDVCEAFIQSPHEPSERSYKEFEVAPTGQWLDVAVRTPREDVDWDWHGGIQTAAEIAEPKRCWRAVLKIPFAALGRAPQPNDTWRANLFRISRHEGERQFMAYAPTLTEQPDFHQPEKFVSLQFAA
ncbi:MAG: carbohydrate-binding family 9-like protein [Acidobacteria bacterium]|nr:carbohydrate-binding family 9-like protein [Acidobacteriota bacterium]